MSVVALARTGAEADEFYSGVLSTIVSALQTDDEHTAALKTGQLVGALTAVGKNDARRAAACISQVASSSCSGSGMVATFLPSILRYSLEGSGDSVATRTVLDCIATLALSGCVDRHSCVQFSVSAATEHGCWDKVTCVKAIGLAATMAIKPADADASLASLVIVSVLRALERQWWTSTTTTKKAWISALCAQQTPCCSLTCCIPGS